jgi:hypothetical protein
VIMASQPDLWAVPELGPSLGRLVDPPISAVGALRVTLEDVRLDLVTGLFDLAGAARSFVAAGDHAGAVSSLGRLEWLRLWERAVATTAARIAAEANAGLGRAAAEARFPLRRLRRLELTDEDTRAIGARLGSGGAPFVASLDALEQSGHTAGDARGRGTTGGQAWQAALAAAARRLESAWIALEQASRDEQERWAAEIAGVRGWRRPTWPVWVLTVVLAAAAAYIGLVLGGYLPVPEALEGLASFWWAHL